MCRVVCQCCSGFRGRKPVQMGSYPEWRPEKVIGKWKTDEKQMENRWKTDENRWKQMKNRWKTDEKQMKNRWKTRGTDEKQVRNRWRTDKKGMYGPDGTWTRDWPVMSRALWPTELQALDGNLKNGDKTDRMIIKVLHGWAERIMNGSWTNRRWKKQKTKIKTW